MQYECLYSGIHSTNTVMLNKAITRYRMTIITFITNFNILQHVFLGHEPTVRLFKNIHCNLIIVYTHRQLLSACIL